MEKKNCTSRRQSHVILSDVSRHLPFGLEPTPFETDDIDAEWDDTDPPLPPPRQQMPTLLDEDPLRHDPFIASRPQGRRRELPTLPDMDPLRYDLVPDDDQ
ncbi:MAG TPA: hypothetical protein VGJ84_10505 [Polyangiaceae bacterium]|jgi:hypothetical protein